MSPALPVVSGLETIRAPELSSCNEVNFPCSTFDWPANGSRRLFKLLAKPKVLFVLSLAFAIADGLAFILAAYLLQKEKKNKKKLDHSNGRVTSQ
jgi:hypothetical protein